MSKSDPQIEVYIKESTEEDWEILGKTEIINNELNPNFSNSFEFDFYFERK